MVHTMGHFTPGVVRLQWPLMPSYEVIRTLAVFLQTYYNQAL